MNLTNEVSAEGKIHTLLFRLGVTPNYTGFFHATHAAELVMGRPERLLLLIIILSLVILKKRLLTL